MMLAARAYQGEASLRLEEVDQPAPAAGEVVIKVEAAGMAYGVLEMWQRGAYPVMPRTLGNEAAGTIAEVGPGVEGLTVGDRVRMHPNLSCRSCEYCRTDREQMCTAHSIIGQGLFGPDAMTMHKRYVDGGLAEYVLVPAWLVDPLAASISFDAAAKVHDVADGLRAWKTSGAGPGATVVLTAATGVVGSAFVRLAPLLGIGRLIAVARSSERLERLRALAPDLVQTVAFDGLGDNWEEEGGLTQRLRELAPAGTDAVLDFLPSGQGSWQSVSSMRMGGSAVFMGANMATPPIPTIVLMINCWRVAGNRNCTREDASQVMRWMESGLLQIDDLITHHFALSEVADAMTTVRERRENTWMVVVHP